MLWTCAIKSVLSSNLANGWSASHGVDRGVTSNHRDNSDHWNSNSNLNKGWGNEISSSAIHNNKQQQWDILKPPPPSNNFPSWNRQKAVPKQWTTWETEREENYRHEFSNNREGFSSGWKSSNAYPSTGLPTTGGKENKYGHPTNELVGPKSWPDPGNSNRYKKFRISSDNGITGQGWNGHNSHSDQNSLKGRESSQRYQQGWTANSNGGNEDNTILEWWEGDDSDDDTNTNTGWSLNTDQVWNAHSSSDTSHTKQEGWLSHPTSTGNQNQVEQKDHTGPLREGGSPQNDHDARWRPQSGPQGEHWRPQNVQQVGGWRPQNDQQGEGWGPQNGPQGGGWRPQNNQQGGGWRPQNDPKGGGLQPQNDQQGGGSGTSSPPSTATSQTSCRTSRPETGKVCNGQALVAISSVATNSTGAAGTNGLTSAANVQLAVGQSIPLQMAFGVTMPAQISQNFTNTPILHQQQFNPPVLFAPPRRPPTRRISLLEALIRSKIRFLRSLASK